MLALALGVMLVVPALAVEPRVKVYPCPNPTCHGAVYSRTEKVYQYTDANGKFYKYITYYACDTCSYNDSDYYYAYE